jgi:ketosteroid isomerase-like protein
VAGHLVVFLNQNDLMTKAVYNPQSTKEMWDHHVNAVVKQDIQATLADYTEDSWIKLFYSNSQKLMVVKGLKQIEAFFTNTFNTMTDRSGMVTQVEEIDETSGTVFLVWKNIAKLH